MKGSKVKIIFVMVCLFLMVLPITQAIDSNKETKQTNPKGFTTWGRIIEAHCDVKYIPDANGSYGTVVEKYFVFGIGRHTIDFKFEHNTYWQEGSWNNQTYIVSNWIGWIKPISRRTYSFNTNGTGDFIFEITTVTLSVDGVVMDSDYCVYPMP